MSFNLTMLNLWIGMCRGVAGLPKDLRKLGYEDKRIELLFANQYLKKVCPDLIVASERLEHTLLPEWKEGANTEAEQLEGYSGVNQNDLETRAFISHKAARSHDIAVVGRKEHSERLQIGIKTGEHTFPLLVVDDDGVMLEYNEFQVSELTDLFSKKLNVDLSRVPTGFVPLDVDSAPSEVAEIVMPRILVYMSERRPRVGSGSV